MKLRDRSQLSLFLANANDNADRAPIAVWLDPDDPNGDNFAGGGGAKLGISWAERELGIKRRAQDVAVNHWPEALAMYAANHPGCKIYCEDVHDVDPVKASGGRRYALAWFSPTCIFFSQARGGPLDAEEATKVRGLASVMTDWAASKARPRVSCLENVKQFEQWGPLHRVHSGKCSPEAALANGKVTKDGVKPKCLKGCCYGRPIKARKGEFFRQFVAELRLHYRHVSWRVLKAHHFGAPTSRERFFLIASDAPVEWPTPTHGPGLKPYRTAAECIDWTIECPSIFERARPLADKTLERIRAGIDRFVFRAGRPFIVHVTHGGRVHDADGPAPTVTCANRGELGIVTPYLVHRSNGERAATETTAAQRPRVYDATKPLTTIMAQGAKHGLAMPVLIKNNGGNNDRCGSAGQDIEKPLDTIATRDQKSIAMMHLTKLRGTSDAHVAASAGAVDEPLDTVSANGTHHGLTAALLLRYNGTSLGQQPDAPLSTIDTKDRFALVTLTMERGVTERALRVARFLGYDAPIVLEIDGEQWILVDIGFRMLEPPELFLCQGFPPDYVIAPLYNGKPLTKTAQIKCVGNSVPPQLAAAVAKAAIRTIRYDERRAA